jgi:hypothetical protein
METARRRGVTAVVVAVLAAGLLPLAVVAPSAAKSSRVIDGSSFERSLRGWARATDATRLDRVNHGRGSGSSAARLRPPKHRAATIGITDAPALVRSTHARTRYVATAWVRATSRALRPGPVTVRLSLGERSSSGRGPTAWQGKRLRDRHWHKVSVPFTSRQDGRHTDLTVRALDVPRRGALLVDSIRLARSPLPRASDRTLAGTRFGASVDEGRLEWQRALRKSDRRYSRMEVVRVFEPVIRDAWSGQLGDVNRPLSISFVAPAAQVLSGQHDRTLRAWFRHAPGGDPIWWTYWHEPEDNIAAGDVSARRYRAAWRHIHAIARRVGGANLHPTLVLMAWTARSASGRRVRDYYPGDFIDVIAWDGYNPPGSSGYAAPREIFGPAAATTKRLGNRFAIAEVGSVLVPGDEGSRRARWLVNVARFAAGQSAAFVSYWDAKIPNEDYQLRDLPSRLAWRSVVKD